MATGKKRLVSIKSEINVELNTVRFWAFDNIKDAPIAGLDFRVDVNRMNPAMNRYAILDGVKDSIRDAGALGVEATIQEKFKEMKARAEYLTSGTAEWSQKGAGRVGENVYLLTRVLMEQKPSRNEPDVFLLVQSWTPEKRKAMLATAELKKIAERISAEQTKNVDTKELFAELDELDA